VSVLLLPAAPVVRKWHIPAAAAPTWRVSADGKVLWLFRPLQPEVYRDQHVSGRLLKRIPVGAGPHGCASTAARRYSLGTPRVPVSPRTRLARARELSLSVRGA